MRMKIIIENENVKWGERKQKLLIYTKAQRVKFFFVSAFIFLQIVYGNFLMQPISYFLKIGTKLL